METIDAKAPEGLTSVAGWLMETRPRRDAAELLTLLTERLIAAGVPVWRCAASTFTLHPEVFLRDVVWQRGQGCQTVLRPHGLRWSPIYIGSPVEQIQNGVAQLRVRLDGPAETIAYPALRELALGGATDYLILPLPFSDGRISYVSWATDAPGGFSDEQLAVLHQIQPMLALRFEIESAYFATRNLLEVYLGQHAAERVLAGGFRRGTGEAIGAAVLFCDLRGFTRFTDEHPVGEVVATLDRYFEALAGPIARSGGEVLKFIGDALLAIFTGDGALACARALEAARGALDEIQALNGERGAASQPPLGVGVALHHGEVMYGNIGAARRLDFTVIGRAVNEVCRVESLCKELGTPLLVTGAFAAQLATPSPLRSIGRHPLRGVAEPQELFTLA